MKFNTGNFEDTISKSFCHLLSDAGLAQKGMRRFRVYIYIFIFGCIHESDMAYVFPEDNELENRSEKELLNLHRSTLNFLARKGDLEKLNDGYYILRKQGLEDLHGYLLNLHLIDNLDLTTFSRKYRATKSFLSHSSKTGRIVLSFVKQFGLNFIREPIINSNGDVDGSLLGTAYNNFIIPDALLFFNKDDEKIYIEADSSLERINSKIIPKLQNYISYVFLNEGADASSTLHFSIWNAESKDTKLYNCRYDLDKIVSFYCFLTKDIALNLNFSDYITLIYGYNGTCQAVYELSSILKKYKVTEATSIENLKMQMDYSFNSDFYNQEYISRSNAIFACSKKVRNLNGALLNGTRFICTPFSSYDSVYKYIYLEYNFNYIKKFIDSFIPINYAFLEFKKMHCFIDEKTGFSIVFRNVFVYNFNGKFKYFSFENISDDISGLIRSKYYAYSYQIPSIGDFSLYCVYNEYVNQNPAEVFERSKRLYNTIHFISYKEMSHII